MAWNLAFSIAAAAVGLVGFRLVDPDPAFDFQVGAPQLDANTSNLTYAVADTLAQRAPEKTVSVSFRDARVKDVLSWLDQQGVSYVVSNDQLKKRSISLNVKNEPLSEVIEAVGLALGGHWERRGNIHVFQTGPSLFGTLGSPWMGEKNFAGGLGKGFSEKDFKGWTSPDGTKFRMFEAPDGKAFKFEENGKPFFAPDGKNFGTWLTPDGKDMFKGFAAPDGKAFKWSTPDVTFKEFDPKSADGMFLMKHIDYEALLKSLTDKQKDIEKSQGYLKLEDLTPKQREMLGLGEHPGSFAFVYERDGHKLTIKSK